MGADLLLPFAIEAAHLIDRLDLLARSAEAAGDGLLPVPKIPS